MKLKCGLEIHQRLDTCKLFCNCYADPNKTINEKEFQLTRKLEASSGELGDTDDAALFESKIEKTFEYNCGEKTSCLVEADEEPPHALNEDALKTVLQVAKTLKANIVNEAHVMRKAIIDGSAVSGFQRTALIALNGKVKVGQRKIGIETISLEEESARVIDRQNSKRASYCLDRMGIPLIEIATAPDIDSAELAKETALEIGTILRNTGKMQRGLGTIRQDINISIEGGERIEIKGCQDLDAIQALVENEVKRQQKLIEIKEKLIQRKAKANEKSINVTPVFEKTQSKIISNGINGGGKVHAIKLDGFAGLLAVETLPEFTFGKELNDHAKQAGAKGIMHSDEELEKYGVTNEERKTIEELLCKNGDDAFVLCVDGEATAKKALKAIVERANYALQGVPRETRKADGKITRFMRPLGSSARMYPETDVMPRVIHQKEIIFLEEVENPTEKKERYKQMGLNEELAGRMATHAKFQLFEKITGETRTNPSTVAVTLLETLTALRREGVKVDELTDKQITGALAEYEESTITKAAIAQVLKLAANSGKPVEKVIFENNLQKMGGQALRKIIIENNGDIAAIMKKYKANVDPIEMKNLIEELKKNGKLIYSNALK